MTILQQTQAERVKNLQRNIRKTSDPAVLKANLLKENEFVNKMDYIAMLIVCSLSLFILVTTLTGINALSYITSPQDDAAVLTSLGIGLSFVLSSAIYLMNKFGIKFEN
eukprot:gene2680-3876_t